MTPQPKTKLLLACMKADWQQVVLNGGPPCFHLENERLCFRARRWDGHNSVHEFISFTDFCLALANRTPEACTEQILLDIWEEFAQQNQTAMLQNTTVGQVLAWARARAKHDQRGKLRCQRCGEAYGRDTHRCPEGVD